jgi:hypothetical protein
VTQGISTPVGSGAMPTTGRWGWYQDHDGMSFRRVSTLIKEVETDNHHLEKWKLRQVAEGMSVRDDLVLALKAMGRPPAEGWTKEQKGDIDKVVETAQQAAKTTDGATTGTAMHTLTERVDRGEPIDSVAAGLPPAAAQSLRAYAHLRELNGWRTVEIERTVVCDEFEVAGTFDRIEHLPELAALLGPGDCQYPEHYGEYHEGGDLPVIADVKTEKDPTLNGLHIGPQLAIYSRARRMWRPTGGTHDLVRGGEVVRYQSGDAVQVPNGEYVPAPCVRQDVAVVVHIAEGDANPLLINLTEGWSAAQAAYEQINRKARAKRKVGAQGAWFVPLPTKRASRLTSFVETAAAAQHADPYRPGPGQVGVTYATSGAETVGGHGSMPPVTAAPPPPAPMSAGWSPETDQQLRDGTADEAAKEVVRGQLIAAIWQARTIDALAILWKMANDRGVKWIGPVAMAGDARKRQIECGQRALHSGSGKCACGWMAGQVA